MDDTVRWILINNFNNLNFIGKDVIATFDSKHILLYNFMQCNELVYSAKDNKSGDGIECLIGHKALHIFAFAEKANTSRVFLIKYPDFKVMSILKDNTTNKIICLEFVEKEYIVALSSSPSCKIIVWCWRTERKLLTYETGIQSTIHILRASANQNLFCHSWDGKLCVWEIIPSYKSCMLQARPIYKENYYFVDFTWTNDDNIYGIDADGNVYSLMIENLYLNVTKECFSKHDFNNIKSIANYKNGLIIQGKSLQYFRKNKLVWNCLWTYDSEYPIIKIISSSMFDVLICVSSVGDVFQLSHDNDAVTCSRMSYWDRNITMFDSVGTDFIVTLNMENMLCLRSAKSGELKSRLLVNDEIFDICSCPVRSIIALSGGSNGLYGIILIEVAIGLKQVNSICLSDKVAKNIIWSNDGTKILTSTSDSFLYYLEMNCDGDLTVLQHIKISGNLKDLWFSNIENTYLLMCTVYSNTIKNEDICDKEIDLLQCYNTQENIILCASTQNYSTILSLNESDTLLGLSKESGIIDILVFVVEGESLILKKMKVINLEMQISGIDTINNFVAAWSKNLIKLFNNFTSDSAEIAINPYHYFDIGIKKVKTDSDFKFAMISNENNDFVVYNLSRIKKKPDEMIRKYNKSKTIQGNNLDNVFNISTESWLFKMNKTSDAIENIEWKNKRQNTVQMNINLNDELKKILSENLSLPLSYQLPIMSFIMNKKLYEEHQQFATGEYMNKKQSILDRITAQNKVTEWIKKSFWDSIEIIGTELNSIFTNKHIENYSLSLSDNNDKSISVAPDILNSIEILESKNLSRTWKLTSDHNNGSLVKTNNGNVTTEPFIFSQMFLHSYLQLNWYTQKTNEITRHLRLNFNKQFDKTMILKQEELKSAKRNSDRLQEIISELNALRKLKGIDEEIKYRLDIPQWAIEEIPNKLITIESDEIGFLPYVSPSEEIQTSNDETIKNPFYEQKLKVMMDGTLDKLWHEEIKKEIPKPKCMVEKSSEDFTSTDIIDIENWKHEIETQQADRIRYGAMLRDEFQKLSAEFNERINNFNKEHSKLYALKLNVESAIAHEELKLMLLRVNKLDHIAAVEKEKDLELDILGVEMEQDRAYTELNDIQSQLSDCYAARDVIVARNRMLDKNFRTNFPDVSPIVIDLCYKLFQKRPKWPSSLPITSGILTKMAQACLTKEVPEFLHADCYKYLKSIDQSDLVSNMPPLMDETVWINMCKLRRIKIDNEFKERAIRAEISDVEAAYATCQKRITMLRSFYQKLKSDMSNHHTFMENQTKNTKLQLIIKSGLVEIKTTGHLEDFEGAILIKREEIEAINDQIKNAEQIKYNAVQATTGFKKYIMSKEWEHATMKIKVKQLETDLYYFERIKVTREVQKYLQAKSIQRYSRQDIEHRLQITKSHFHRQLFYQIQYTEELEMKVGTIQTNIQSINKKIDLLKDRIQRKQELIDSPNNEERKQQIIKRMKSIVGRNKLVMDVQKQQTTIILLQTELELQRLRTYPTLTGYQTNH